MANIVKHNDPFGVTGPSYGPLSLVYIISSGTVTLQKLMGNDPDNAFAWTNVTDGEFSASGECTFWAPKGQQYRVQISGTANVSVAG